MFVNRDRKKNVAMIPSSWEVSNYGGIIPNKNDSVSCQFRVLGRSEMYHTYVLEIFRALTHRKFAVGAHLSLAHRFLATSRWMDT